MHVYRLMEVEIGGGKEFWSRFKTDDEAIKVLKARFDMYIENDKELHDEFTASDLIRHGLDPTYEITCTWVIQKLELEHMKEGVLYSGSWSTLEIPWKTIFVCYVEDGDDAKYWLSGKKSN